MEWNPERARVEAEANRTEHWAHWGPYLSDRQWGTVREDYSRDGDAWAAFPYEQARSRAYRWGEDGIFGICDDRQRLCFAPAFWNGNDATLKERFFGLSGPQGNHGEDVKEQYYYLDNVPSHAYMKALYKYPHRAYPYERLIAESARRTRDDREFELVDTGIFDDDAYFDIFVEYAKASPTDVLARIVATNRGTRAATLHVVPHLWFRNEWSWSAGRPHGTIVMDAAHPQPGTFLADHPELGAYRLLAQPGAIAHFTENETNDAALFGGTNAQPYVKDAIDRAIVRGESGATNPANAGSKLGLHYAAEIAAGGTFEVRVRLTSAKEARGGLGVDFDATFAERLAETHRFYAALDAFGAPADRLAVQRAALAGMLWSKQFYFYVVRDWLSGDPLQPVPPAERLRGRNHDWRHLFNDDVLAMPDTWEYPWYAAWDLAFHTVTLALVDPGFAKRQLLVLTREWYMHPSGALPAYEWALGDANPPVHAWAAYRIFLSERKTYGLADYAFLERVFQKLLMNFTWWVNREDPQGENVFMGGFLGLDNIGVFNRSEGLPAGSRLIESDATSWMAVYALDMLAIAIELAKHNPSYEDIASKFYEHFLYIASAINDQDENGNGLWDDADGFYYDRLVTAAGERIPLRVRSLVGLVPLFAVEALPHDVFDALPSFARRVAWFVAHRPELGRNVASMDDGAAGERRLLALLDREKLDRLLRVVLDEAEFLSDHGIRSLSRAHRDRPLALNLDGHDFRVEYEPAESRSGLFGGNSNWRGPVWMPMNFLIVEALRTFASFYGDEVRVAFPTGSQTSLTLAEVAHALSDRLVSLFVADADGRRPALGDGRVARDPHFRDLLLFHEYFHGETGEGLGASHQTGWTGLVATLVQQMAADDADRAVRT